MFEHGIFQWKYIHHPAGVYHGISPWKTPWGPWRSGIFALEGMLGVMSGVYDPRGGPAGGVKWDKAPEKMDLRLGAALEDFEVTHEKWDYNGIIMGLQWDYNGIIMGL